MSRFFWAIANQIKSHRKIATIAFITVIAAVLGIIAWGIFPAFADKQVIWQTPQISPVYAVAAEDIDGDSVSEVVYGGHDSKLYVRKYNHTTRLTNPYPTFSISAAMNPEIIRLQDLDGDGKKDIIVAGPSGNKVEAYSFANNTLAQIFSVAVSSAVYDLTVGQITDINGNTGIDVAAVTAANKVELVYNNAGTWTTGYTADTVYQPQRVEAFVYSGGKDAVVVTTVYGISTFLFEAVDNPAPVWAMDGLTFGAVTYNVFGPLAISNDIVNSSNINGTDGVPEILVGTRDQKWGIGDMVIALNGKTGVVVWNSRGDQAQLGRVNDIKIQNVRGTGAKRYITVGTGLGRDGAGNLIEKNHVLLFDLNGSGLNNPNFKRSASFTWDTGEVLSVTQGYIDHATTDNGDNTHIAAITGMRPNGQNSNKVLIFTYNFANLTAPVDGDNTKMSQLATTAAYTWTPRSTYWISAAAINPQDNWRDLTFVHPGNGGVEATTFDNRAPAISSVNASPSTVTNPWNNNVTYTVTANEGSYVRTEILKNDGSTLVKDLGWKVADFNGANAVTSFVWDGKYTSGGNYDETTYRLRVTVVDNEKQFDGNTPLTIPVQGSTNRTINTYGPYTVNIDLVAPSLGMAFFKDAGYSIPLAVYNGNPITKSGSPVYVRLTGSESLVNSSVHFTVYDVHQQSRTLATWLSGNTYTGIWRLNLPAQDGVARIQAEGMDNGGNYSTQISTVLVDNTVTKPTVSATNNLNGKVLLNISGIDPDHKQIKIYRSTVSGFAYDNDYALLTTLNNPVSSSYEDKKVQPNQTYYYRVRQTDNMGNTVISNEVAGKSIPGLTFNVDYYADSAMTQPLPKNPDGKYVANLRSPIYIKFTSSNPLAGAPTFTVDAPGSTANDIAAPVAAALIGGTVYQGTWGVTVPGNDGSAGVKVTATDIYGQSISGIVPEAGGTVTIDTTVRVPNLSVRPGPTSADLTWTKESDTKITKVYRSLNPSFTPADANLLAIVWGSVYHDPGLDPGLTYYYKIIAADYAGNISSPSNTVSVKPAFSGPHSTPVLKKAAPTSKQLIYLTFDEPVIIRGNPATWTLTQNVYGTPPGVAAAEVVDDRRIIKVVLAGEQGIGNQLTPLTYTLTLTGIEDDYGTALPQDNVANRVSWEAFTPHGKYSAWSGGTIPAGSATPLCGLCHTAHNASGNKLLPDITIKKACFICHGVTGSSAYKVEGEFVARSVYGMPYSYSLHKSLDSDDPGFDVLSCVDCHNPHGDVKNKNLNNTIYPKLLRASDAVGNKYYAGNQVCLACHGNVDRGFESGSYYAATGGNHINPVDPNNINASNTTGPVHYDNVNFGSFLNPATGTNITCMKCHEKHGSQYVSLIDNSAPAIQEGLCFKSGCHGTTTPAKNVYNQFYGAGKISRHDVRGDTGKGKLQCTSCHGPHNVDNTNTASTGKASNPDNTKQKSPGGNAFCLKCHDGDPPQKTTTATTIVPSTVTFDKAITSSGSGWNKSQFANSGHGKSGYSVQYCSGCHTFIPHGSTNPSLLIEGPAWNIDGPFPASATGCLGLCHRSFDVGGVDMDTGISEPFSAAYKHPTFTVNGVHSDTEDWASQSVSRHAECMDCHDVHTSISDATETGILGQVTGIAINNWNGATWSNWSSTTPDWSLQALLPGSSKQYQLCLKCHSKFSYNSPPITPSSTGSWQGSFNQTDIARDFNPVNPAYHAVIGASKVPDYVYNSTTYDYGNYINGNNADTVLKCTNCHAYSSGGRGPHGSAFRYILVKPWDNTTGTTGTGTHLCFSCHDYNFYTGADAGNDTARSQFSRAGSFNLHRAGASGDKHRTGCVTCHGPLPHGWDKTDSGSGGLSLMTTADPRPYSDGVKITSIAGSSTPGNWTKATCSTAAGCH